MPENEITITHKAAGRSGWVNISVKNGDEVLATEKLEITKSTARRKFVMSICGDHPGLDYQEMEAHINRIADDVVSEAANKFGDRQGQSQADMLVALGKDIDLFHTPGGHDGEAYASFNTNGHRETWAINSKGFRRYLCGKFFEEYDKVPGAQAVQDALNVLNHFACHDRKEHEVSVRIAGNEGDIWLDLADSEWRAVEIYRTGWRVVNSTDVPVRFIRRRAMLPLPAPESGGRVDELREMINLPGDDAWKLFVAWLVMAFRPTGPYPVLVVNGEQGSAKSTLCRLARALIDPNKSPVRRPPKDDRDLMIAASNSWTLAFDNLSRIPAGLSDALCALATGGGFATRELYSDGDEKIIDAVRPIMVNGIEDLATRADLMDRALNIKLPVIDEANRREESDLDAKFEEARPRILGALLSAVSGALSSYDSVRLTRKPRMADFARWVTAAEQSLGWSDGSFLDAYFGNREESNQSVIENAVVGPVLVEFMDGRTDPWSGTYKDLLEVLVQRADEKTSALKEWPKTPRVLSNHLTRLAPSLRQIGLFVERGERTKRGQVVQLGWIGKTSTPRTSRTPEIDQTPDIKEVTDGVDAVENGNDSDPTYIEAPSTYTATKPLKSSELGGEGVDGDDGVGEFLPRSNPVLLDEHWQEEF